MHSPHTFDPHLVEEECGRNKKRRIDASLHGSKDAGRDIQRGSSKPFGIFRFWRKRVGVISASGVSRSPTTFDSWRLSSE